MGKASRRKNLVDKASRHEKLYRQLMESAKLEDASSFPWGDYDILDIRGDTVMAWKREAKQVVFLAGIPESVLVNLEPVNQLELRRIFK